MGKVYAYKDPDNENVIKINPENFQEGEADTVDVSLQLDGYDEETRTFNVRSTLAPVGSVETDTDNITLYANESKVITVTTPGTIVASVDDPDVSVSIDQGGRTVTLSVPVGQQMTTQTGNLTIEIDTYTSKIIPFTFNAIQDITINGVPSGQTQYVNEPISITISGTDRVVTGSSSDVNVNVQKNSDYEFTVLASQAANNVDITFSGDGVKTRSKRYNFSEQETGTADISPQGPYYVNDTCELRVTGVSSFDGMTAESDNPNIEVNPIPGDQGAFTIEFLDSGSGTVTVKKRGMVNIEKSLTVNALKVLTASPSSVNATVSTETRISIIGATDVITASSDEPNITANVSGNEVIISSSVAATGNVTVKSAHCEDLVIPVVITNLAPIDYTLSAPSGSLYVGEPYRLTVNGGLSNIRCTSSEPRIKVGTLIDGSNEFSILASPAEGHEAVSGDITISADGKSDTVVHIEYQGLMLITATADQNGVPFDIPITLTLSNGKPDMDVVSDTEYVTTRLEESSGVYKVICTATLETDANILINGRGIKPYKYIVSFTNKDELHYTKSPEERYYYVGEDVEINVTGTTRDVEFTIDDGPGDNATLREKTPQDKYTRILSATSECIVRVGVRGQGCTSISIPNIEFSLPSTPSCSLSKPNNLYIGDVTRLTVEVSKGEYRVEASDPKIIISEVEKGVYDVTASQPVSGTINIIGERGVNNTSVPVEFQDDQTPSVSVTTSETTYDTSIVLTVSGVTEYYTVTTDVDGININKVSEGNYNITATKPCSGDIVVRGDNVKEHRETIRFIDKDTLSVAISPSTPTHFLREKVTITVSGTTKPYSITAKNKDTDAPISLTTDAPNVYSLTSDVDITVEVTIAGTGIHSKVFDVVYLADETPSCRFALNGDVVTYMYSNETVILIIDNVTRTINVTGDSIVTVNKNREGLYEVTASSSGVGNITISGQGVTETIVPITVKDTYEVQYEMEPSNGIAYVNKLITVRSLGDEEITVTAKAGSEFLDIQNQ